MRASWTVWCSWDCLEAGMPEFQTFPVLCYLLWLWAPAWNSVLHLPNSAMDARATPCPSNADLPVLLPSLNWTFRFLLACQHSPNQLPIRHSAHPFKLHPLSNLIKVRCFFVCSVRSCTLLQSAKVDLSFSSLFAFASLPDQRKT